MIRPPVATRRTPHLLFAAAVAASLVAPRLASGDAVGGIISYQGKLSTPAGQPVADGYQDVTCKIYEGGTEISTQTLQVATVGGVFNAFLNLGTVTFDPARTYALGITALGEPEVTQPIAAVPVAVNAVTADNVTGATDYPDPDTVVKRDPTGSFAGNLVGAGALLFYDGTLQCTAYDPYAVVQINPTDPQTMNKSRPGINLAFGNGTSPKYFARFGLDNATISGTPTTRGVQIGLRADGGILARGAFGAGEIPETGGGERMMWYPGKAALRAGSVGGPQWDDAAIGNYSIAAGRNPKGGGLASVALGDSVDSSGDNAVALGDNTTASGPSSTALGKGTVASGNNATALGINTTASGNNSTALGRFASTNSRAGSFVYGDNSTTDVLNASANNQFAVRAQRIWLGKTSTPSATAGSFLETSTGAYLSDGGTWTNSSSRTLKRDFKPVNGREVLRKVAALPMQTWKYKAEPGSVHIGPMAQDFYRTFRFGGDNRHIGTVDADGVALAAIQGLNAELKDRDAKIKALEAENAAAKARNAAFEARLRKLEQRMGTR